MSERDAPGFDAFERSLETAFRSLADRGVVAVDAVDFAERVTARPRRRVWLAWPQVQDGLAAVPAIAWILLATGLLAGLIVGGLVAGSWLSSDHSLVIVPPPSASAPALAGEATILATTKAHPLPAQATCPPGSDPDAPRSATSAAGGALAFDRHAGRIVMLTQAEGADETADPKAWRASQTWTYDVCANTWQRMSPPEEPKGGWGSPGPVRLVYDADSDRTLAYDGEELWSYELAADRWTKRGSLKLAADGATNVLFGTIFYHDPSGLVVIYDGLTMWAYDVDTNTLSRVPQLPDPSLPVGSGLPAGKIALGYDPRHDLVVAVVVPYEAGAEYLVPKSEWGETWTFDPGTGAWRRVASPAASDLIVCGVWWRGSTECYQTFGRSVFDEASGLTVFITRDYGKPADPGRVDAYDAGTDTWRTLSPAIGSGGAEPYWCRSTPPVYDPLNGRIVCEESGRMSAFSTATGQWRWLVEP